MYVNELIEWLKRCPPDSVVKEVGQPSHTPADMEEAGSVVFLLPLDAGKDDFHPIFDKDVTARLAIERHEAAIARIKAKIGIKGPCGPRCTGCRECDSYYEGF